MDVNVTANADSSDSPPDICTILDDRIALSDVTQRHLVAERYRIISDQSWCFISAHHPSDQGVSSAHSLNDDDAD